MKILDYICITLFILLAITFFMTTSGFLLIAFFFDTVNIKLLASTFCVATLLNLGLRYDL